VVVDWLVVTLGCTRGLSQPVTRLAASPPGVVAVPVPVTLTGAPVGALPVAVVALGAAFGPTLVAAFALGWLLGPLAVVLPVAVTGLVPRSPQAGLLPAVSPVPVV
jgi:hypothetical protein